MPGNGADDSSEVVRRVFDALTNAERRYAFYYLRDRGTATAEELATVVSGWVQSRREQREVVTPADRKRVLVSLHHTHLPKLEAAGLVRYDHDTGGVSLDATGEVFDDIVSEVLDYERQVTDHRVGDETDREREGQ